VLELVEERPGQADLGEGALRRVGDVQVGEGQLPGQQVLAPHVDPRDEPQRVNVDGAASSRKVGSDPEVPLLLKPHECGGELPLPPPSELVQERGEGVPLLGALAVQGKGVPAGQCVRLLLCDPDDGEVGRHDDGDREAELQERLHL
jgi:hypothetical protein